MTGQKVGFWTVLREYGRKDGEVTWLCKCECGKQKVIKGASLRGGYTRSCGCKNSHAHRTHGMSSTRLYKIWKNIKARCYNKNVSCYERYGGRGIKMCDEWRNSSEAFINWALNNGYTDDLTIERINCNSNYSPDNCKFIPLSEQPKNRRNTLLTVNGVTKTKSEWAREFGINLRTLSSRINRLGWSPERAVSTPTRAKK